MKPQASWLPNPKCCNTKNPRHLCPRCTAAVTNMLNNAAEVIDDLDDDDLDEVDDESEGADDDLDEADEITDTDESDDTDPIYNALEVVGRVARGASEGRGEPSAVAKYRMTHNAADNDLLLEPQSMSEFVANEGAADDDDCTSISLTSIEAAKTKEELARIRSEHKKYWDNYVRNAGRSQDFLGRMTEEQDDAYERATERAARALRETDEDIREAENRRRLALNKGRPSPSRTLRGDDPLPLTSEIE